MSLVVADRVQETTNTTGTGAYTLGGAVPGFQSFGAVTSDADTVYYAVTNNADWEVGMGTYTASGGTLARTTIFSSSNSNNAVNWGIGTKNIFLTYPADKAVVEDASNNVTIGNNLVVGGTVDGVDIAARDAVLTSTTNTADAALPKAGGTMSGAIAMGTNKITGAGDPTAAQDLATKSYVDTIAAAGLHYHDPVRVEKEGTLTATYDNGASGVGATLTNSGTQAALVIDGITMVVADRVLVYEQTDAAQNGIYTVTDIGSASTNWVLTRATDADSYGPSDPDSLGQGDAFFVQEGTLGAGETYVMNTEGTITFGTTDITFAQVSSAQVYVGGTGVTISGTDISIGQSVGTGDDVTFNSVTGNASSATALATGRTIGMTGDVVWTSAAFDGTGNVTGTATIQPNSVALGTDTTGNYVAAGATSGTGLSGSVSSEGGTFTVTSNATASNTAGTIVARDGSGDFTAGTITADLTGDVTGDVTGNADTATALATGRTISLTGDVTGTSASFDGSGNVSISATIAANAVGLGTDTTGDYVASIANGSFLTGGGASSEGKAYTLGVDATDENTASKVVARDALGDFAAGTITADLSGNASTATTLETSRTINGVAFDGSANITVADSTKVPTTRTVTAGNALTGGGSLSGNITINHEGTSSQGSVNNSGATVIQDVTLDTYGHVTGLGSATITPATIGAATSAQGSTADSAVQPGDNVSDLTNDAGYTTNVGDITAVTAGTGLSGGGSSGGVTLTVDLSELTDMTATMVGTDEFIVLDSGADRRKAASEIGLSIFNNDAGFTTNVGDITGVTAGSGISGGGTSGTVTINHADTSSQSSVNNSGRTYIQDITLDTYGHITGITSATETVVNTTYSAGTALDLAGTTFNVDLSELSTSVTNGDGDYFVVVDTLNAQRKLTKGNINISGFNNDAGYTTNIGDITGVTAGSGITGGGTSGTVTISHADTSSQSSVNNSGANFIQDITLDTYGHITAVGSATITPGTIGAATSAQGSTADSAVQPGDLATVATTGGYGDLTGKPTLGTAAAADTGDFASAAQGSTADSAVQPGDSPTFGSIIVTGTVDGRDVASDGTKLDGIEAGANVTDTANVTAAGALMDSEVTNLAQVKAFDSSDYATAAQGDTADSAVQPGDSPAFGSITVTGTVDGRDVAADGSKLDGIEAGADVTDTANVTAAGALMDSEVTNLAQVKAFDSSDYATAAQGSTADSALQSGANISELTNDAGYTTNVGDITGVTAGTDMTGGGTSGTVTINHAATSTLSGTYGSTADGIKIDQITVDARGHVTAITTGNTGDIFGVTAGSGLTGGGTSGTVTLNHADTSSQSSVNNSGRTYIQDITLDTYGHITGITSATETVVNTNQLTTFQVEDGDGTEVTISQGKEWKFVEAGGININWTDTSPGSDADPYDLSFSVSSSIIAGSGLSGGGVLSSSRTLSHADTSSQSSVNNSGATVIQDVSLDTYGHVTSIGSATLTPATIGAATSAQGSTADSAVQPGDLATVATSGSYNDLTNKPTIPSAYTNSSVDAHLNTSTATADQVLSWNGSDYDWITRVTSIDGGSANSVYDVTLPSVDAGGA